MRFDQAVAFEAGPVAGSGRRLLGKRGRYQGLTFWSPNVNIFRDPRWGRGQETYGEDPFLTGTIGTAFVRGMQGADPRYLKTVATAKHYAVHSGPEKDRHRFDARVSMKDMRETYLPAFEKLVKAGVRETMMAASTEDAVVQSVAADPTWPAGTSRVAASGVPNGYDGRPTIGSELGEDNADRPGCGLGEEIGTVEVGKQPSGLDISKKGEIALVTNRADNSISVKPLRRERRNEK